MQPLVAQHMHLTLQRVNPFSCSGHVVSHLVTPGHTPVTNQQAGSGSRESTESALLVDLVSQFKKCGHKVLPFFIISRSSSLLQYSPDEPTLVSHAGSTPYSFVRITIEGS